MLTKRATNLIDQARKMLRQSLGAAVAPHIFGFVHKCVDGGEPFVAFPHLCHIGERIARAVAQGGGRIIVNLPPRHGKSFLASKLTPAWFLDKWPERRVIVAGYGAELAQVEGRWVRNLFDQKKGLRTRLSDDSTAADRWNTPEGGGMKTGGVGTGITGFGGHLMIFDDPYKDAQQAYSPAYRQQVVDWYKGVFYDRQEPGATIIVCHHRWHPEDLTNWLLTESGDTWDHIRLPALAEAGDPLGRQPGEALCPQRYDVAALRRLERTQGEFFAGKYQQAPREVGTGRVYGNYGEWNEEQEIPVVLGIPLCLNLDFNINPGMHGEIAQYDSRRDLFTVIDEIHGPRMTLHDCLTAFEGWVKARGGWKWGELRVYGDASGSAGSIQTGESHYDIIRARLTKAGIPFTLRVRTKNPPIVDRLAAVNDALRDSDGVPHVKVSSRCVRLRADFKGLKSNEQGTTQKQDDKLSHASEAFGYMVEFERPIGGAIEFPRGRHSVRVAR